ncbi:MAG: hypothetical protein MK008_06000 [Bdellovibrionales bacterium]|nr:hypothetical protein [Bdellovibrionales bacterium]
MEFQQIIQKRAKDPMFTKSEIEASLRRSSATKASVANILKRAVARNDLIRLRSGIYCLPEKFRKRLISPFELLNKLDPYAYVTGLTALSHLNLIPEAIGLITAFSDKSIAEQKPFRTQIGTYRITKVPRNFLMFGVENVYLKQGISYRMATPLKAILDHAFVTQKVWPNRDALIYDLRLDEEYFATIDWSKLGTYKEKYQHPLMTEVCENLYE